MRFYGFDFDNTFKEDTAQALLLEMEDLWDSHSSTTDGHRGQTWTQ